MTFWGEIISKKISQEKKFSEQGFLPTCQLCDKIIKTSAIKCSKCSRYLHTKCFEKAAHIFDIEKDYWQCRECLKSNKLLDLDVVRIENQCLKDQVRVLTKLVSEQDFTNCIQKQKIADFQNKNANILEVRIILLFVSWILYEAK